MAKQRIALVLGSGAVFAGMALAFVRADVRESVEDGDQNDVGEPVEDGDQRVVAPNRDAEDEVVAKQEVEMAIREGRARPALLRFLTKDHPDLRHMVVEAGLLPGNDDGPHGFEEAEEAFYADRGWSAANETSRTLAEKFDEDARCVNVAKAFGEKA